MIDHEKLIILTDRHSILKKKFSLFKRKILTQDKIIPLDYIMTLPTHLRDKNKPPGMLEQAFRLENQFKNVAIRRLE